LRLAKSSSISGNLASPDVYGRVMRQKLTQQEVAGRVGSSRERVNGSLKDLSTGGHVSVCAGRYVIHRELPRGRCRRRQAGPRRVHRPGACPSKRQLVEALNAV
jgi:hypothetical protein